MDTRGYSVYRSNFRSPSACWNFIAQNTAELSISASTDETAGSLGRTCSILGASARKKVEGGRITHLAQAAGLKPATVHRLLRTLVAEGLVEQDETSKVYRLGIELFALGASAGHVLDLRTLCRQSPLRPCASLVVLELRWRLRPAHLVGRRRVGSG